MRQAIGQVRYETDTANGFERVFLLQFLADEDWVDFRPAFKQADHGYEDSAMRRNVEIFGLQHLNGLTYKAVIENDGTQNSALSFGAVGQRAFKCVFADRIRRSHELRND